MLVLYLVGPAPKMAQLVEEVFLGNCHLAYAFDSD